MLRQVLEQKEAQLDEVLARANLEPSVMGQMRGRVEDVLQHKSHEAKDLQARDRLAVFRMPAQRGGGGGVFYTPDRR